MGFATLDGFERDVDALYRYKIEKAMFPVRIVKEIIDRNDVMADRLRSLCPISEDEPVTLKTADGEVHGHVTMIAIRSSDGFWNIGTDVYPDFIDFGDFIKTNDGWFVEV